MDKKAICLFVVGQKYEKLFSKLRNQFEKYADHCQATLVIIKEAPDSTYFRPLLSQKLLLPSLLTEYDICLFMDLDILIANKAPNIFEELRPNKAFGAILDPRDTEEFKKTWQHIPRILQETNVSYFTDRNFEDTNELMGSINGGVFLFRPQIVAPLFKNYYYSAHNQGALNSFEESPMAHITQTKKIFQAINPHFNTQVLYKIKGTAAGLAIEKDQRLIPKIIRNYYYKLLNKNLVPTPAYNRLVKKLLKEHYFLHFSGNHPIPKIKI